MSVIKLSDYENRRAIPNAEYFRILVDCRDLTTHRLLVSFASMMDRLGDRLLDQANRSSVLSDSTLLLETRAAVQSNRAYIVSAFETGLRERIDRRLRGEEGEARPEGEEQALEIVDDAALEEDIALKKFVHSLVEICQEQLLPLNARVGFLLGERALETEQNPFGPMALGLAFRDAWRDVEMRAEGKLAVLRLMDAGVIGDVNSIYADLNRHLANLNVLPNLTPVSIVRGNTPRPAAYAASAAAQGDGKPGGAEDGDPDKPESDVDLFEMLRDVFVKIQRSGRTVSTGQFGALSNFLPASGWHGGGFGAPTAAGEDPWSGFGVGQDAVPVGGGAFGSPAMFGHAGGGAQGGYLVDPQVIESLTRLQQDFGGDYGGGVPVAGAPAVVAAGMPLAPVAIDPNLLRRLTPRDLGTNLDATGAMTIELVAMLFDFMFADRQLPDAIKALLGRLQIPVLKAAMLDREFFSRRKHPARLLVNRYAEAGIAWQPEHGTADPLYLKIHEGVARIQSDFTDKLELFSDVLADFEQYLAEEEREAEQVVQASAEDITTNERQELAGIVANAELDRRIGSAQPPEFLEHFLRDQWRSVLTGTYLEGGEESEEWRRVLADTDNLLWSVQPKRTQQERRELVGRLPQMLSRLRTRLADVEWATEAYESFLSDLASTHARAVTATKDTPVVAAATPVPLATPISDAEAKAPTEFDRFHELADTMTRGMWVEFAEENDVLVFAKLSWVSPLRGKYLFTHRNGLKAFSLTREELAQRFRDDTARPVEAEPLLDRAFSDVMSRLSAQVGA